MPDKFDKLEARTAADFLEAHELVRLAQASKKQWTLFRQMVPERARVHQLLKLVVRGERDMVCILLKTNANLLFKKSRVTDCSGRTFEHISPFEYALWALDKHMWTLMMECILRNEQINKYKIFTELLAQYNKVQTAGITYWFNGVLVTESHFDFKNTIIGELEKLVNSLNAPDYRNWDFIDKQWREGVGGVQKLLPMHVVCEYCSDEAFYPVPTFTSRPKPAKHLYNWLTDSILNSKMGVHLAAYKGAGPGWLVCGGMRALHAQLDLGAMQGLYKVRTEDFVTLKSQLEEQMAAVHCSSLAIFP